MGALQLQDQAAEADRVYAIGRSFHAFREAHGRFPTSFEEWESFETEAETLLKTGPQAVEPKYQIRWSAFGDPAMIVLMSPDRDFSKSPMLMHRADKAYCQESANREGFNRFVIMGDGAASHGGYYPWEAKRDFAEWAGWTFVEEQREPLRLPQ